MLRKDYSYGGAGPSNEQIEKMVQVKTPEVKNTRSRAPEVKNTRARTPEVKYSRAPTQEMKHSRARIPEVKNANTSDVKTTELPEVKLRKAPEVKNTRVPATEVKKTKFPAAEVKNTKAPETKKTKTTSRANIMKAPEAKILKAPESRSQTKALDKRPLGTVRNPKTPVAMIEMRAPDTITAGPRRPSALELENSNKNARLLMATPIRVAMMQNNDKNIVFNPGAMVRSATSLKAEDLHRSHGKRTSDFSNHHGSSGGVRPGSLVETERKRSSDPIIPGDIQVSNASSFRTLFGNGFLKFGNARNKKPSAVENSTPDFKRTPGGNSVNKVPRRAHAQAHQADHKKVAATKSSKGAKSSPAKKNQTSEKDTSTSIDSSTTSISHNTSAQNAKTRRKKSTRRKGFFSNTSQCAGQDLGNSSSDEDEEVDGGVEKKWPRSNSLRRTFNSARHNGSHQQDPAAHSDTEIGKITGPHSLLDEECGSVGGSVSSERAIDVGRVGSWATSFEKLLEDPAGLHTFAEFLHKEYSHENIYFWTACERYKRLSDPDQLGAVAKDILDRHLVTSAPEPVNVDSQARQHAHDGLHNPNQMLFAQAQKQIFNLMKFDSYTRFLKSGLYKDCVSRDMRGQTLPYPGDDTLDRDLRIQLDDSHVKLKKSRSDAEERRRKSLLPWNRKDRSKSKDRGETEYRRRKKQGQRNTSDSSSIRSDISGSHTSLNSSSDLPLGRRALSKESLTSGDVGSLSGGEGCSRCRVMLPDLSNSVVAIRGDETVQALLSKLLEKRNISYSTFDVYLYKTDKLIDKREDSSVLSGQEVRIEQRVLFRLDLPGRKTVCVKAKPGKVAMDVLKPILLKYGYKLDLMFVHKLGEEKGINPKCQLDELDGDRLVVQTKEEVKEWGVESGRQKKRGNTLDEITNRVFEDLLKGKADQNFDELGILDFDARSSRTDNSSDRSSGMMGGFSRRNSLAPEKDSASKARKGSRCSVQENMSGRMLPPDHMVTKRRGNNSATAKQENDELYEGLKRAQRSRLDDQRGTEINFELPDFLKCDQPQDKENQHAHLADQLLAHLECSFSDGAVIPTHQQAEDYFSMAHPEVWGGLPASPSGQHSANATLMAPELDLDFDETLRADDTLCMVPMPDTSSSSLHVDTPDFSPPPPIPLDSAPVPPRMPLTALPLSPPPLPPKPKVGGVRGPPPRPPSRQLHLLNPPPFASTSDDDALHSTDPIHITRQTHDKFNISFV